jgi:hypothetical protein
MRTEQQLRDALNSVAEQTPSTDDLRDRLLVDVSTPTPAVRWRPVVIAATVALTLVLAGAIAIPHLTRRSEGEPADGPAPGRWTMISRIDAPPGWSTESREMSRNAQTTTISDPTGKGICRVETGKAGVAPQTPITGSAQPVTVGALPALYQQRSGQDAAVYWHYSANAWASVSCTLGPKGLAAARTPQQIQDLIVQLAGGVAFGQYPLRLPIRIEQLPTGYGVLSVQQAGSTASGSWGITLSPAQVSSTAPIITVGPANGSSPEANTRVSGYAASFVTTGISGPVNRVPRTLVSYTSLCVLSAPVQICVVAANTADDEPESRRDLFQRLASQITYAAHPTDATTWFDAATALPS